MTPPKGVESDVEIWERLVYFLEAECGVKSFHPLWWHLKNVAWLYFGAFNVEKNFR